MILCGFGGNFFRTPVPPLCRWLRGHGCGGHCVSGEAVGSRTGFPDQPEPPLWLCDRDAPMWGLPPFPCPLSFPLPPRYRFCSSSGALPRAGGHRDGQRLAPEEQGAGTSPP